MTPAEEFNATAKKYDALKGQRKTDYWRGFWDGNESNYHPCLGGKRLADYDWGYRDGKAYGPRKGKRWTIEEMLPLMKKPG